MDLPDLLHIAIDVFRGPDFDEINDSLRRRKKMITFMTTARTRTNLNYEHEYSPPEATTRRTPKTTTQVGIDSRFDP